MALAWALAVLLALVAADPATLTVATFGRVLDGSRHALVLFHAPWCTHCTEMMPAFEVLSRNMANEPSVVVARVDGSSDGGSPLRLRFGVTRYPTIKFFAQGSSEPEDYVGERNVRDLTLFLNAKVVGCFSHMDAAESCCRLRNLKAGTKRSVKGLLLPEAGRNVELEELAQDLVTGARQHVSALMSEVQLPHVSAAASMAYYRTVARKVEEEGVSFVAAQQQRMHALLQDGGNVDAKKRDELTLKLNILDAFVPRGDVVGLVVDTSAGGYDMTYMGTWVNHSENHSNVELFPCERGWCLRATSDVEADSELVGNYKDAPDFIQRPDFKVEL